MLIIPDRVQNDYRMLPFEKAAIVEENKALLRRLAEYKPYLRINPTADNHHH